MMVMGWSQYVPGLSLAPFGMPGCYAHVSLDNVAYVTGTGGEALWTLPIPYAPALVGVRFYNQAVILDAAAGNALGAVVSEAAVGLVGG